jgi:O-antigen/teichoic acid export membrane protein
LTITAPEITLILFGQTWLPIIPIFRLMLVYVVLDPLYANLSYLIVGVGRPDALTRVRLVQVLLFVILVIAFAQVWGTNGVAVAANFMMLSGTVILLILSRKIVEFSLARMLQWPLIAATLTGAVGFMLIQRLQEYPVWTGLMIKALSLASIYVLILYLAERQIIHEYSVQILRPLMNRIKTGLF